MGDFNQYLWVKNNLSIVKPDVLEIGSRFYSDDTFNDFRKLCIENNAGYIGADLSSGKNVDVVVDFTDDIAVVKDKLKITFKTVICCSVLEHVKDMFQFAKNVSEIIDDGGAIFLSVPFTWEFHGYPNDYWRFTPASVEYLFNRFDFPKDLRTISSHIPHDIKPFTDNPNPFCYSTLLAGTNDPAKAQYSGSLMKNLYHLLFRNKIQDEKILYNSIGTTRIFKPSCINMIGFKKK